MRYLKILLDKTKKFPSNYPANYEAEIGIHQTEYHYYDEGDDWRLVLCIPDDKWSDAMIRPGVVEITEAEMQAISATYDPPREKIVDEAKFRRLELLAAAGQPLSPTDLAQLDPASPTAIIKIVPTLADRVAAKVAAEEK